MKQSSFAAELSPLNPQKTVSGPSIRRDSGESTDKLVDTTTTNTTNITSYSTDDSDENKYQHHHYHHRRGHNNSGRSRAATLLLNFLSYQTIQKVMLRISRIPKSQLRSILFFASILIVLFGVASSASDGGKCASSKRFDCPTDICNDGESLYVGDCLDCKGYFSTDSKDKVCFDRKIFNAKDNPRPAYLYYDIIGAIVWFCAAGVATACGVGGGGIYVPLGILLLQFAPKPSSGLSQSSIFGASLGGLILNIRNRHPFATKVEKVPTDSDQTTTEEEGPPEAAAQLDSSNSNNNETTLILTSIPNKHNDHFEDTSTEHYYTRPLIDYDMALFLAPMEMAGAVLGVLIQKILPNWLYLTLAAIILGLTAKKTYAKYNDARAKEKAASAAGEPTTRYSSMFLPGSSHQGGGTAALQEPLAPSSGGDNNNEAGVAAGTAEKEKEIEISAAQKTASTPSEDELSERKSGSGASHGDGEVEHPHPQTILEEGQQHDDNGENHGLPSSMIDEEKMARRKTIMEQDARQYPMEKLFALFVLWVGLIILTFLKGGKGVESIIGITCESPWFGVLIGIQFAWTLGFAVVFAQKLINSHNEKVAVGYQFHPQDVHWDYAKTRFYAVFTFFAGIVAGLIGIGGGMVLGPLMLIAGIHPRVSSATTATMIVLTSSSVAILFVTAGLVPWEYAVTFFSICFCGAYIGKTYIDSYVKRTGKASVLIFLLATIIALATIGCIVIVFTKLADANWCFDGFQQFCNIPSEEDAEDQCEATDAQNRQLDFLKVRI